MSIKNQVKLVGITLAAVVASTAIVGVAVAQSGHFIRSGGNAPRCTDIGTQVQCSGKVAGLGGTEFTITIDAAGTASVECINPGGNRAPGQDTSVTATGSTGPIPTPQNGQFRFTNLETDTPTVPNFPTCPNPQWTANVVDVAFTTATLSLFEDGVLSDQVTVLVQ